MSSNHSIWLEPVSSPGSNCQPYHSLQNVKIIGLVNPLSYSYKEPVKHHFAINQSSPTTLPFSLLGLYSCPQPLGPCLGNHLVHSRASQRTQLWSSCEAVSLECYHLLGRVTDYRLRFILNMFIHTGLIDQGTKVFLSLLIMTLWNWFLLGTFWGSRLWSLNDLLTFLFQLSILQDNFGLLLRWKRTLGIISVKYKK